MAYATSRLTRKAMVSGSTISCFANSKESRGRESIGCCGKGRSGSMAVVPSRVYGSLLGTRSGSHPFARASRPASVLPPGVWSSFGNRSFLKMAISWFVIVKTVKIIKS